MLKKLIKYEILADWKKYGIVAAALLLISVMLLVSDKMSELVVNDRFMEYITATLGFLFFALIVVAAAMLFVFSTTRFYKSFIRDEGYLTHTLPVPTWQLIASKLIAVYIWFIFLAVILVICSGIALGMSPLWIFNASQNISASMNDLLGDAEARQVMGIFSTGMVMMLLSPAFYMAHIYLSFALGNLFNKNKLGMSVLMFFVISFAERMLFSTVSFFIFMELATDWDRMNDDRLLQISSNATLISLIFYTVIAIVCFIVSERIFAKKLNLE